MWGMGTGGGGFIFPWPHSGACNKFLFFTHQMETFHLLNYKSIVINFPFRVRSSQILLTRSSSHPFEPGAITLERKESGGMGIGGSGAFAIPRALRIPPALSAPRIQELLLFWDVPRTSDFEQQE